MERAAKRRGEKLGAPNPCERKSFRPALAIKKGSATFPPPGITFSNQSPLFSHLQSTHTKTNNNNNNATQTRLPNLPARLHRPPDPKIPPVLHRPLQTSHDDFLLLLLLLLLLKDLLLLLVAQPDGARSALEPRAALPECDAAAGEARGRLHGVLGRRGRVAVCLLRARGELCGFLLLLLPSFLPSFLPSIFSFLLPLCCGVEDWRTRGGGIGWGLFFVCWGVKRSGVESSGVRYADVWVLMGHSRSMRSSPASAPRSGSLSSRPVCGSRRIRRTRWSFGVSVMSGEFSDMYTLSLSLFSFDGGWTREDLLADGDTECYRAFADFVLGSLILHFFCVNFIN